MRLLGLLFFTANAFGQSSMGAITGVVSDRAGTPIVGANVQAANLVNGDSRTTTTNGDGRFIAFQLPPGSYSLTVDSPGFRKLVKEGFVLTAAGYLNAGTVVLDTGTLDDPVRETADAGQLSIQSTSGERSGLLTNSQIRGLLLNGRNMLSLLSIIPGTVSLVDGQVSSEGGLASVFFNGARGSQHNLTIDGASNVQVAGYNLVHVTVNPDAVAEVRVLTANYQAEYGRSAGGFIQFVTQSGGRDFHGSVRLFHRHEGLNANNYFRNAEGRNSTGAEIQPRELYRYNYAGYNFGGPVPLGAWNRNRDKLFFFWSQEFYRQLEPASARNIRVPTEAERRGDFSQTVDGNGNKVFIRDPNMPAGTLCNAANQTACFPGNTIPPERIFADGPAILNVYPLPNFPGQNQFNYTSSISNSFPRREDILRVDYNISDRTRLSARYIYNPSLSGQAYLQGNNFVISPIARTYIGRNGSISLWHSFSPTLTNEFIFGPSSSAARVRPLHEKATRRANQISFPLLFPEANPLDYLPSFVHGGIANIAAFPIYSDANTFPDRNINHTFDFTDNVAKVWNSHLIKTGVFLQRSRLNRHAGENTGSTISFTSNANNPLNTGHPFANALLGIYNSYQQANNSPRAYYRYTNLEGYIQDNWKVTPRLSLDYGLRIAWYQPQYERRRQTGFFNPELYDFARSVRLYEGVLVGNQTRAVDPAARPVTPTMANTLPSSFIALIVPGSGDIANGIGRTNQGYPRGGFDSRGPQWGPRFSFAFDPFGSGRSVVRGGFGITYDRNGANQIFGTLTNPPTVLRPVLSFGRLQDLSSAGTTSAPPAVTGYATDGHVPTVYSYSLGIQGDLGFNMGLDVAYVATLSRHLLQSRDLNAIPYGTTFTREAQDPTLYGGVVPDTEPNLAEAYRQAGLRFSGANAKRVEFLRPFPGYGNIFFREFVGSANYHSLQIALDRRFSRGLQFSTYYAWSKALTTSDGDAGITHPYNTRAYDYRLALFDRTHSFIASFVYQAPKLSNFLADHWLARAVLDNWQVSGITSISSGAPLELAVTVAGINPSRITGSYTEAARFHLRSKPQPGSNGLVIDPDAFVLPRIADPGPWSRQYLRAPGTNNHDLALLKNFLLGSEESRYLQLRLEMFNAFNHTQFSSINTATNLAVPAASGGFATGSAIFNNYSNAVITNNVRPAGSTEPLGRYFGEYNSAVTPRVIQLAVKLYF
jgi:hypothetical protein